MSSWYDEGIYLESLEERCYIILIKCPNSIFNLGVLRFVLFL